MLLAALQKAGSVKS